MGLKNAPLAATVTANSIVQHINDALVTQEMVEPRDVLDMNMRKATRVITVRESWGNDSPIDMPGCGLLYNVVQRDIRGEGKWRKKTRDHFLPLSADRRHEIKISEEQDKILTTVQLIDNVTLASSMRTMTTRLTEVEKNKIKFRIRIAALNQKI